jgi:hypothetical protein
MSEENQNIDESQSAGENPSVNKKAVVETFAGDMAKVLTGNKDGLIRQVIQEEEMKEVQKQNLSPDIKKNKILFQAGLIMTLVSAAIFTFLILRREQIYTVEVQPQFVPLIFTDQTEFINIGGYSRDEVVQAITNKAESAKVKYGGVEGIYLHLNKKVISLHQFMAILKGHLFNAETTRVSTTSVKDDFLLGVVNGETKDLFLLIKVKSFADAFSELRNWESKIFADLASIFQLDAGTDLTYLYSANFEDGFIQNKNARILYDENHNMVLMYVFLDDTSVLITNTESAVRESMLRLSSSQIRK